MQPGGSFEQYIGLIEKKTHVQWEHQYKFVFDANGKLIVDKIMKFENFDLEITSLMKTLNIAIDFVRHDNKGSTDIKINQYDESTYDRVAKMYIKDFELFDYKIIDFQRSKFSNG